jgi:hypothetical protein
MGASFEGRSGDSGAVGKKGLLNAKRVMPKLS